MKHWVTSSTSRAPWFTIICLGVSSAFAPRCSGDGASDGARAALLGGWGNPEANLFVCFANDGRMWLGDSRSEIGGPSHCIADAAAASFECTDPDDAGSFGGSIAHHGDELTLDLVPCPPDVECHGVYFRDATLTCGR
jgi:hypothetical protein